MANKTLKNFILIFGLSLLICLLNYVSNAGVNDWKIVAETQNFERVIFVPGIMTSKFHLRWWKQDLAKNFPDKEIIFLDEQVYFYWQDEKMETIVKQGVEILNDNKETLIIAHSFGGILAKTMISRADNGNITGLITMASPHQLECFGVDDAKDFLDVPEKVSAPTFSFGGYVDPVVLFPYADAEGLNHFDLWSGHNGFLLNKEVRQAIFQNVFGDCPDEIKID